MALTLREYASTIALIPVVIGLGLTFSGGVFSAYDVNTDSEEIQNIREDFQGEKNRIGEQRSNLDSVNTRTDVFFLSSVWNLISETVKSVGRIRSIVTSAVTMLGLPPIVANLAIIPVIAVLFEVISLARGMRT